MEERALLINKMFEVICGSHIGNLLYLKLTKEVVIGKIEWTVIRNVV